MGSGSGVVRSPHEATCLRGSGRYLLPAGTILRKPRRFRLPSGRPDRGQDRGRGPPAPVLRAVRPCLPPPREFQSQQENGLMTDKKTVLGAGGFIQTTGAAAGAMAAAGTFAHPAIGATITGANDRINFAVLGAGGRATSGAHRHPDPHEGQEGKAVDHHRHLHDVWDGSKDVKDVRIKVNGTAAGRRPGPLPGRPSGAASTPTTRPRSPRTTGSSWPTRTSTRW